MSASVGWPTCHASQRGSSGGRETRSALFKLPPGLAEVALCVGRARGRCDGCRIGSGWPRRPPLRPTAPRYRCAGRPVPPACDARHRVPGRPRTACPCPWASCVRTPNVGVLARRKRSANAEPGSSSVGVAIGGWRPLSPHHAPTDSLPPAACLLVDPVTWPPGRPAGRRRPCVLQTCAQASIAERCSARAPGALCRGAPSVRSVRQLRPGSGSGPPARRRRPGPSARGEAWDGEAWVRRCAEAATTSALTARPRLPLNARRRRRPPPPGAGPRA